MRGGWSQTFPENRREVVREVWQVRSHIQDAEVRI